MELHTQNYHAIHNKIIFLFFVGILSFHLSCGEELSGDAEEYVDRDDILENIEIYENSGNLESTNATNADGEFLGFGICNILICPF